MFLAEHVNELIETRVLLERNKYDVNQNRIPRNRILAAINEFMKINHSLPEKSNTNHVLTYVPR